MGQQDQSGRTTGMCITPRPAPAQQIAEGAENCLRHNSYLALKNVRCECAEGVLTLRGCLPTYYLKQMAQAVVARIEGVQRVVNEIEVVATSPR
jgi:osmotically-inducible protein OsmY